MIVVTQRSLAQQKIRFNGIVALVLCIVAAASFLAFGLGYRNPWVQATGALAVLFALVRISDSLSWWKGDSGEKKVLRSLSVLPDAYTAITNVILPGTKQGDIDLVVCGPPGAVAIECKNFASNYVCDGGKWFNVKPNGYRKPIGSPCAQAKRNARSLEKHIRAQGVSTNVYPVVVLPNRHGIQITGADVPVVEMSQLADLIQMMPSGTPVEPRLVTGSDESACSGSDTSR